MPTVAEQLASASVLDALNRTEAELSNGGKWESLWTNRGQDTVTGWTQKAGEQYASAKWAAAAFSQAQYAILTLSVLPAEAGQWLIVGLLQKDATTCIEFFCKKLLAGGNEFEIAFSTAIGGEEASFGEASYVELKAGDRLACTVEPGGVCRFWRQKEAKGSFEQLTEATCPKALSSFGAYVSMQLGGSGTSTTRRYTNFAAGVLVVEGKAEGSGGGTGAATGTILGLRPPPRKKPPLELDVEIETPTQTFRLAADAALARNRPSQLSFSTQRGDGFTSGQALLNRDIFHDYPDLNLLDTWRFIGRNGDVAYEGRLHSLPRASEPQPQITASLVGWMTYLKSRRIAPLIIDRKLANWGPASNQRQADILAGAGMPEHFTASSGWQDSGERGPGVAFNCSTALIAGAMEYGEQWYYGGGESIRKLIYDFTGHGLDTDWQDLVLLSNNDRTPGAIGGEFDVGTDHNGVSAANQSLEATTATRKYACLDTAYAGATTGSYNITHFWTNLAVVGDHGLVQHGTHPKEGFYVSDVLQYVIEHYYPKIRWAGEANTFVLLQADWHDAPTDGYAVLQQINELVLWETNMWENRTLHFAPADLSHYDWQLRTDDPGVSVVFQGESIENFANGVPVTYEDFGGKRRTLWPPDHAELRDDSEDNPANRQGEYNWPAEIPEVPFPCLEAEALQFGRAYLAEYNRPKRPGTYRIAGGYIRDGDGQWHQGWKVRNSETVGIMDLLTDEPRLITQTSWDQDSKTLEITVDAPPNMLDAVIGRMQVALEARGLR